MFSRLSEFRELEIEPRYVSARSDQAVERYLRVCGWKTSGLKTERCSKQLFMPVKKASGGMNRLFCLKGK